MVPRQIARETGYRTGGGSDRVRYTIVMNYSQPIPGRYRSRFCTKVQSSAPRTHWGEITNQHRRTLVSRRGAAVAFGAGGFLSNLHADAGADARGAGFDHGARVGHALYAARSFDAQFRSDYPTHQSDIGDGRATLRKSRRSLDEISAGTLGRLTGAHFFVVSQQRGFDDHFAGDAVFMRDLDDRMNVVLDQTIVAALQRADINYHVDFARTIHDRSAGFVGFHIRQGRAQRKSNHRA